MTFSLLIEHADDELDERQLTLGGRVKRVRKIGWSEETGTGIVIMVSMCVVAIVALIATLTILALGLIGNALLVLSFAALLTLSFNIGGLLLSALISPNEQVRQDPKKRWIFSVSLILAIFGLILTLYLSVTLAGESFNAIFNIAVYSTVSLNLICAFLQRPLLVGLSFPMYRKLRQYFRYKIS